MDNITRAVNTALINSGEEDEIYRFIEYAGTDSLEDLADHLRDSYPIAVLPAIFSEVTTALSEMIDWEAIAKDWIDGYKRDNDISDGYTPPVTSGEEDKDVFCPVCRGIGTIPDELTPGVVRNDICSACEGSGFKDE